MSARYGALIEHTGVLNHQIGKACTYRGIQGAHEQDMLHIIYVALTMGAGTLLPGHSCRPPRLFC
jgi:hypothetical protein